MSVNTRPTALQAFAQQYGNDNTPASTQPFASKSAVPPSHSLSPLAEFAAKQSLALEPLTTSKAKANALPSLKLEENSKNASEELRGAESPKPRNSQSVTQPLLLILASEADTTLRSNHLSEAKVTPNYQKNTEEGDPVQNATESQESKDSDYLDFSSDDESADKASDSNPEYAKLSDEVEIAIDDLYDLESGGSGGVAQCLQKEELLELFLPKSSDIELFHCTLTHDQQRLKELLTTLLRNRKTQDLVFGHIDAYYDARMTSQFQNIMQEKGIIERWLSKDKTRNSTWMPPGAHEVHRKYVEQKEHDWKCICESVDEGGRSLLHYAASSPGKPLFLKSEPFLRIIRKHPELVQNRDSVGWMPLHFAVKSGNMQQIKWYFDLGICFNQEDVSCLISLNQNRSIREALLQKLEKLDGKVYYCRSEAKDSTQESDNWDLGLGVFARAKMERGQGSSTFLAATKYGNMGAIALLIQQGTDPKKVCDLNGWNALHVCANEGTHRHVRIAKMLLEPPHSLSANSRSLKGRTPLHIVAKARQNRSCDQFSSTIIEDLCLYGAEINARDSKGYTPLHLASRADNLTAVSCLLKANCDIAALDRYGCNALHLAVDRSSVDAITELVAWEEGFGYLSKAANHQGRKPADMARNEPTRLLLSTWQACYRGEIDTIKRLIHSMQQSRSENRSGRAIESSFVGIRTPQTLRTPLHITIQGYFDALYSLRNDSKAHSVRHTAASTVIDLDRRRYRESVSLLVRAGIDLTATDKWGITPTMLAATIDDEVLMSILLDGHSDVYSHLQQIDSCGNTALHYSYAFCQAEISSLLEEIMEYAAETPNGLGKLPLEVTGFRKRLLPEGCQAHMKIIETRFKCKKSLTRSYPK